MLFSLFFGMSLKNFEEMADKSLIEIAAEIAAERVKLMQNTAAAVVPAAAAFVPAAPAAVDPIIGQNQNRDAISKVADKTIAEQKRRERDALIQANAAKRAEKYAKRTEIAKRKAEFAEKEAAEDAKYDEAVRKSEKRAKRDREAEDAKRRDLIKGLIIMIRPRPSGPLESKILAARNQFLNIIKYAPKSFGIIDILGMVVLLMDEKMTTRIASVASSYHEILDRQKFFEVAIRCIDTCLISRTRTGLALHRIENKATLQGHQQFMEIIKGSNQEAKERLIENKYELLARWIHYLFSRTFTICNNSCTDIWLAREFFNGLPYDVLRFLYFGTYDMAVYTSSAMTRHNGNTMISFYTLSQLKSLNVDVTMGPEQDGYDTDKTADSPLEAESPQLEAEGPRLVKSSRPKPKSNDIVKSVKCVDKAPSNYFILDVKSFGLSSHGPQTVRVVFMGDTKNFKGFLNISNRLGFPMSEEGDFDNTFRFLRQVLSYDDNRKYVAYLSRYLELLKKEYSEPKYSFVYGMNSMLLFMIGHPSGLGFVKLLLNQPDRTYRSTSEHNPQVCTYCNMIRDWDEFLMHRRTDNTWSFVKIRKSDAHLTICFLDKYDHYYYADTFLNMFKQIIYFFMEAVFTNVVGKIFVDKMAGLPQEVKDMLYHTFVSGIDHALAQLMNAGLWGMERVCVENGFQQPFYYPKP